MHGCDGNRILKVAEMCASNESAVNGNAMNPDLIRNLDKGSGDMDSSGNWKRTLVLGSAKHDCLGFVWVQC